jgi:hypothetical protein
LRTIGGGDGTISFMYDAFESHFETSDHFNAKPAGGKRKFEPGGVKGVRGAHFRYYHHSR